MKRFTAAAALALAIVVAGRPCRADSLMAYNGNIVLIRPLTTGGKDRSPVLSTDGQTGYFVRAVPDREAAKQWDGDASQIMSIGIRNGETRIVLNPIGSVESERNLRGFSNLALSPDGKTLFFIAYAWATSGAVHALDLLTGKERYICPGNDLMVVGKGQYIGDLAIQRHKYMVAGGSEDSYWLTTPDGKEIGLLAHSRREAEAILDNN